MPICDRPSSASTYSVRYFDNKNSFICMAGCLESRAGDWLCTPHKSSTDLGKNGTLLASMKARTVL